MKKLSFLLLSLALCSPLLAAQIEDSQAAISAPAIDTVDPNKENTIFLWDLHHVVIKPRGTLAAVMRYPNKGKVFKDFKLQRKLWGLMIKGIFKESASDKFIHLAEKYNNPHLKELIIQASNAQKIKRKTVAIIEELAKNGYRHHVGSNIGYTAFAILSDPNESPDFHQVFRHFDLKSSHVAALSDGKVIKKPDPAFFKQYLEKNNIDLEKTRVIFIDDKKSNIAAAKALGFETILFKNAQQLRNDLIGMGIEVSG